MKMSRIESSWYFVDYRKHPMLLVYEIVIGQRGTVGVKVIARILNSVYGQEGKGRGDCGQKYLVNLGISRRRNAVKRLGYGACRSNLSGKIGNSRALLISPRSVGNMGAGSPVSISAPAASILDHTVKEDNDAPLSTNVPSPPCNLPVMKFPREGNEVQTCTWLRARGFQTLERTFANFSAADMLALSRDDVIQICGVADGIRLFNALRYKPPPPELTLYFAAEGSSTSVWHAVYLDSLTSGALASKLITSFNLPNDRLHSILLQGPQGVHIMVSDELVANMKNSSMYLVETVKDSSSDRYKLLLQPFSR